MLRQPDSSSYRVECGCGFAVEGGEDEVVDAARHHADRMHGIELADGIARALARPLLGGSRRDWDRDDQPGGTG